ncbi:CRISPR-associated protein Cas4 [uncultured Chloroflexus sp.]|uniref:CRISPR-associated protein Cas4 n=1 Tax=uncultured Chloroflexus sp. TaxID=214040 RepID=UPI00262A3A78|nr:CRISPR-associated protein Cas4 [uncultured Chloroflexus sp.]
MTIPDLSTIEVSDIKQWRYCQRVVWYTYCLPAIRPKTDLMRQGAASHRAEEDREERRSLRTYGLKTGERFFNVYLRSEPLGVRGILDLAIAIPNRNDPAAKVVVVDYKDSEQAAGPHFKLQVGAYALLIEEVWGLPVETGWIYHIPLRRAEKVVISPQLRQNVREAITAIQRAILTETLPPPPSSRALCVNCEFRRFCNDVV